MTLKRNPKPKSQNPEPRTTNPKPQTQIPNPKPQTANHKPTVVFDVNETLLDLSALDPLFNIYFGDAGAGKEWFTQVLQSAFASTIMGPYRNFGDVARAALSMVAARRGAVLKTEAETVILAEMRRLPAHPDVLPGFEKLRSAGLRMAALTNSPPAVAQDQLTNAGLADYLEAILSVDASKSLKPARIVYDDAVRSLGAAAEHTTLVAAHAWDIAGAMRAGWHGLFLARRGKVWNPLFDSPTFMAGDLTDAADWLIAQHAAVRQRHPDEHPKPKP